jgi:hypothetical protein
VPSSQDILGALQQADAAGHTDDARQLAQLYQTTRAAEDAAAAPNGVSQQSGGITVDTGKAAQYEARRQAQQAPLTRAETGLPDLGSANAVADPIIAGAENFGHNMLGIGDALGGAGRMAAQALHGAPVDYQTAENQYQAQRNYLSREHPVASGVGGLAGAIDTGVIGGAGLKAAGLLSPVTNALAATEGQVVGNIAKMGLAGAAAGAAQGAAQGGAETAASGGDAGQVGQATLQGGAGGAALGGVLGPVASFAAPAVARTFAPLTTKAAAALGRLMGEDPNAVSSAWSQFQLAAGRAPTMAELAGIKAQSEIAKAAKVSPSLGEGLVTAQDAADQARVGSMQAQAAPPTPTAAGDVENATKAQGDLDYEAARQHSFNISTKDDDALGGVSPAEHLAASVLPQAGLKTADLVRIRNGLKAGTLSGEDAQLIQSKLGDVVRSSHSPAAVTAQADLADFLSQPGNEDANAALDTARANFAAGKSAAEGAALGQKVVTAPTNEYLAALRGQTDAQAVGTAQGASAALRQAVEDPAGALATARALATDTGLHSRLSAVFTPEVADALRDMGAKEAAAAEALSAVTPRTPAPESSKDNATIMQGMHGIAVLGAAAPWLKALHAAKIFIGAAPSEAVMRTVTKYLTDPAMTRQGIALLRKAGADNAGLRRLAISAAAMSGALTGSAAGNLAGQ